MRLSFSEIAEAVGAIARSERDIVAIYLFGSHARGTSAPDSDVDLGVLPERRVSLPEILRLEGQFERSLGRKVDLVDLTRCEAFLALDAIRGERVYCADSTVADEFELYIMRRAGDLAPYERERRRILLASPLARISNPAG